MPELTSSGLTHSARSQFKCPTALLELFTPTFWSMSGIVNEMNFGIIDVKKEKGDVSVDMRIFNKEATVKLQKVLSVKKDLSLREGDIPAKMCQQVHSKGKLVV